MGESERDLIAQREQKLKNLLDRGVNPYPYSYTKSNSAVEILEAFKKLKKDERNKKKLSLAGRIMTLRVMGKAGFAHLQDETGKIQIYVREDEVGKDDYKTFSKCDLGDIIGIEGIAFRTKLGELSVYVRKFSLLCKSLRPIPEKWHGLKDKEIRYRKRELDILSNPEVKEIFRKRSTIIKSIREFLDDKEFLEVDIPTLQPVYGGAEARPFVTHLNELDMKVYLSISPELYLKRLIVGGYEKVYTICKNFRNEGIDKTHNPEFVTMECYQAYVDYEGMMKITEELYEHVAKKLYGTTKIKYQGKTFDVKAPWKRISVKDALKKHADIDVDKLGFEDLKKLVLKNKIEFEGELTKGLAILLLFENLVENKLSGPIFVKDYPKEASPLCKHKRGNEELIEKFEPYINGVEMGNAYSELNNPATQKHLLTEQANKLRAGASEAHPMDEEFVEAIEVGMPPTGGLGLGIDRMVIFFTDSESIRDVILWPFMRPISTTMSSEPVGTK
ncbi:MAG: lysine--tRNA ligase [Candidatus Nanoarchaeia archaeon]|nr:lysine--tRNA ligase [Candidatus Nanoarchaeia archaeon]